MKETKNKTPVPIEMDEQELILMEDSSNDASSKILFEDINKRSENVKHFRMKNGQYMAAVYDKPVHTFDKVTGKFVDIAHRFEEKEDCYEAETDRFKARFPKKEGKRKFVTVEKDGRSVSWRYIPATNSHKKHAEASIRKHERATLMELPRFPQLKYEKTESQTDLEYGITERGVKENIILTKRPKHSTFRFELKLEGLRTVLAEDKKSICLYADDADATEPEFMIPPINMTDAAGVYSEAAHYEIVEDDTGTVMEIVVDPEWLLAEERLYPVVVDPQVTVSNVAEVTGFTNAFTLSEENGTLPENALAYMAGFNKEGTEHRIYLRCEYPLLPDGYTITSATLNLHQLDYEGNASYSVHRITEEWEQSNLTWNNQPESVATGETISSYSREASETIRLDISSSVKNTYKRRLQNYGFVIKATSKPCTAAECCCNDCCSDCCGKCCPTCTNCEQYWSVYSLKNPAGYPPMVEIHYTLVDEYADHQKHERFSAGRAGSGAVNLFTGKLSFTHNDVAVAGGMLPLALSHVYRSDYAELGERDTTYGKGWFLSAAQTLVLSASREAHAIYRDAQGRKHYFIQPRETCCGITVYDDSAGLGLTLMDDNKTIIDDKGNSLVFENSRLSKIEDANGNYIAMKYDNEDRLIEIKDSIGRTIALHYNCCDKLDYVTDSKGRKIRYTYDNNDNLVQIAYPNDPNKTSVNYKTVFEYSSFSKLTKVTDQSGIYYEIGYTGTNVTSVLKKGAKTVSRNNVVDGTTKDGGGVTITYRTASTVLEDQWTHIQTVYRFDECGRVTCTYEDLSNNVSLKKNELALPRGSGITVTDLHEYEIVKNRDTSMDTKSKYTSVRVGISGTEDMYPNCLTNGDFEEGTTGWTITGTTNSGVVDEGYQPGYKSYCMNGPLARTMYQIVDFTEKKVQGNVLIASAWAKSGEPTGAFKLYAKLTYSGSDNAYIEREAYFDNECVDEWQYVAIPLKIERGKTPDRVLLKIECTGSSPCYLSNIRLTEARGTLTKIDYNLCCNTLSFRTLRTLKYSVTRDNSVYQQITYYDTQSNAVKSTITDEAGHTFDSYAEYDEKHQPTRTRDYRNMETAREYDDFGNEWWRRYFAANAPDVDLSSVQRYNSKNARLEYVYDPRDKEICNRFTYDDEGELLEQRIDANGQIFDYSHDQSTDQQTAVTAKGAHCECFDITNYFAYDDYYLTQVNHNGFAFNFDYDQLGRSSSVKAAGSNLVAFEYGDGEEESTVSAAYANDTTPVVTTYDSRGNLLSKSINGEIIYEAVYDRTGVLQKSVDKLHDRCYNYKYDRDGNLIVVVESRESDGSEIGRQEYEYDRAMRLVNRCDSRTGLTASPIYEKVANRCAPDHATLGVEVKGKFKDEVELDGIRRTSSRKLTLEGADSPLLTDTYGYLKSKVRETRGWSTQHETQYVGSLTHTVGATSSALTYSYDNSGNIQSICKDGEKLVEYIYDSMNRLTQEINYEQNLRFDYTYDLGSNIATKKERARVSTDSGSDSETTYTYTYDSAWKDKLTSFNGEACVYDALGNPTTYRGKSLIWTHIRRLAEFDGVQFAYNADGIRISKTVNGVVTTYTLNGSAVLKETTGPDSITYYYGNGGVIGFNYKGTDYFYQKNLQNDVTAIYNASGAPVASYVYDAWGKVLSVTNYTDANIGNINPFRYRSYYYDTETGLYYLQTRYYDPEVGRFINSDSVAFLGKGKELINYNLFAYCSNNPVNRVDYTGTKDDDHDGRPDDEDNDFKDDDEETCNPASGGGSGVFGGWSLGGDSGGTTTSTSSGTPGSGTYSSSASSGESAAGNGNSQTNGWKVGQDITNNTRAGNTPSWPTIKARYWKNEAYALNYTPNNQISASGLYRLDEHNLNLMRQGKAPIGLDNRPVHLHHPKGKHVDIFDFYEISHTEHYARFADLHPWLTN